MSLKKTFAERELAVIDMLKKQSDEQIALAKKKCSEWLEKGAKSIIITLTPINGTVTGNDKVDYILNDRLIRTIANWLQDEGFLNLVTWHAPRLSVEIQDDKFACLAPIKLSKDDHDDGISEVIKTIQKGIVITSNLTLGPDATVDLMTLSDNNFLKCITKNTENGNAIEGQNETVSKNEDATEKDVICRSTVGFISGGDEIQSRKLVDIVKDEEVEEEVGKVEEEKGRKEKEFEKLQKEEETELMGIGTPIKIVEVNVPRVPRCKSPESLTSNDEDDKDEDITLIQHDEIQNM